MGLLQILNFTPHVEVNRYGLRKAAFPLVQALEAADYERCLELVQSLSSVDYAAIYHGASCRPKVLALAQAWALEKPDLADASILFGSCLAEECARLRKRAYQAKQKDNINKKLLKKSVEIAVQAQNIFEHVVERDKTKAQAYAGLIHIGYLLNSSMNRLHACFMNGVKHDIFNFSCFYQFFQATTERYGGNHQLMFDFLRWATEYAPNKSYIHILAACAYNILARSELKAANGQWSVFRKKIRVAKYRKEVIKAFYAWLDATERNLAPSLFEKEGLLKQYALNQFTVALYLTGAKAETQAALLELGQTIEPLPWGWFANSKRETSSPGFVYDRFYRELQQRKT